MFETGLQIRFQGLPVWIVIPLAAVALYLILKYRFFLKAVEFPGAALPIGLRAAVFCILIMLSAGPVMFIRVHRPVPVHAAILLDASQSMQLKDGEGESRWKRAVRVARRIGKALETTPYIFSFSDSKAPVASFETLEKHPPTGAGTFLIDAADRLRGESEVPFTDIFIISDGCETSGAKPVRIGSETRVHTIGIGAKGKDVNVGVTDVFAPEYGFVGRKLEITGYIHTVGLAGTGWLGIELFDGDRRVDQKRIPVVKAGEAEVPFTMSYIPEKPGMRPVSVRVKTEERETVVEDNERTAFVDVITEKKSLLYIDAPRWESKFLKVYLEGTEKLKTDVILIGQDGVFEGGEYRGVFAGGLEKFRMVIIGDVGSYLTAGERDALAEYYRDGGQIVVLGGRRSLYTAGGGWDSLLGSLEGAAPGGSPDGFEVVPTQAGMESPLLRLGESDVENGRVWKELPFVQTFNRVAPPGGATVLAEHPWLKCRGVLCPMIYIQQRGQGRIIAFSFEGLWRWAFQEKDRKSQVYGRLWKNILDAMLESGREEPLKIQLSARTVTLGDPIRISVRPSDALMKSNGTPLLRIKQPSGGEEDLRMSPSAGRKNLFTAEHKAAAVGRYVFTVEYGGRRSAPESAAVQISPAEFRKVTLNEDLLKTFSELNGGGYAEEKDAVGLAKKAAESEGHRKVRVKKTLWMYPYLLLLVAALMTAEWIVRRRGGLA